MLRVDKDKGYIDLSKRRVSPEDIDMIEERFNKSKSVHRFSLSLSLSLTLSLSFSLSLSVSLSLSQPCNSSNSNMRRGCSCSDRLKKELMSVEDFVLKNVKQKRTALDHG